ncbi:MAG: tetratricopeptide repeat protein [Saprospiraceae bacterium]|nr:tetratricopeptide repeat protein [Saprospiraceae bacterium]
MKPCIFISFLLFPLSLVAQEKGATPLPAEASAKAGTTTRAVVIGISDYQDPAIPDLRFADRDAEAFVAWLRNSGGAGASAVPEANISVLLNDQATTGKIIAALDGLVVASKAGDVAIIYFSGHGDVERVTKFQRGYWLTYDSPPAVYAAGACALAYLQDIITTLSDAGVQVAVISDACRAGKLAGSAVGGAQATSAALAQQFANEVKILSCQPEEFSLEGEQWGGGRGVFSYHLVDALYGMADANADGVVSLLELGRYLEDKVPVETAPHPQLPFTTGSRNARVATVNTELLAEWKRQKAGETLTLSKIDSKGLEALALAKSDSSIQADYRAFVAALERGDLMTSTDLTHPSANELYKQLIREPALAELHGLMTRNFAAALMDEGQQILNHYLRGDLQAYDTIANEIGIDYRQLADQFYRAAELLGEKHYYHASLMAKGLYFESFAVHKLDITSDSAEVLDRKLLEQAVALDPTATHVWLNLCWKTVSDSLLQHYIGKLNELAPDWPVLHYNLGKIYYWRAAKNPDKALSYYQKALALDSTYLPALFNSASLLDKLGRTDEARMNREAIARMGLRKMETRPEQMAFIEWEVLGNTLDALGQPEALERLFRAIIAVDSSSVDRWTTLGNMLRARHRWVEAEQAFRKGIALDATAYYTWNSLGWMLFYDLERYADMEQVFRTCCALRPNSDNAWNGLGWALWRQRKAEAAEQALRRAVALSPWHIGAWNGLSQIYNAQKRYDLAESVNRKMIEMNPSTYTYQTLGFTLYNVRRHAEAEAAFRKAIELDSTSVGAWNGLGLTLDRTRRYAEAVAVFRKTIDLDSTNTTYRINFGRVLDRAGRYTEAEAVYRKTIEQDSMRAGTRLAFSQMLRTQQRYAEAEVVCRKAIDLDSSNAEAWAELGYLLQTTRRYAESEGCYRKAIELDSLVATYWNNLGFALLQVHRYAESEPVLQRAIVLNPNLANAYKHLATLHFRTGRREEARQGFEKALAVEPGYYGSYLGMAYLLAADGKTDEAFGYLEQAIQKNATYEHLLSDEDLALLRAQEEKWNALMKTYFSEQFKD